MTRCPPRLRRALLVALLALAGPSPAQQVSAPPAVIVTAPPAVLVRVEGAAVLVPVPGHARVQRVQNTRAPVLLVATPDTEYVGDRQKAEAFYLRVGDAWMTSEWLAGPWTQAALVPFLRRRLDAIAAELAARGDVGPVAAPPGDGVPRVYVTEAPAELVVLAGPPRWTNVSGAPVMRAANADRDLLLDPSDRQLYLRTDRGWLVAPRLDGPWSFAAPGRLPPGVATLPDRR
jgi:hypothetical protein